MTPRITEPEQLKELLGIPFTAEQLAAITARLAPQVIVAGAGSGKTTVMAARVVWLVGTGQVRPEGVLGLTFTKKAAGELADRVHKALVKAGVIDPDPGLANLTPHPTGTTPDQPEPAGEPVISTYHAFAGQLLKDHGLRIGVEPTARLLADATRYQLAARVLRRASGPYPSLTSSVSALVSELLALDSELAEHLVDPDRLHAHDMRLLATLDTVRLTNADLRKVPSAAAARLELTDLVRRYRAEKRHADLLDFGDQIAFAATLAQTRPEVGRILREQYGVVLLDEYQDTSVAQRLLLAGLFGETAGHPVTAVGDPCQGIYGWRGASVANLDDFPTHFPSRDGSPAQRFSLRENRRSGGRLLALANELAKDLRARHLGVAALSPAPGVEHDGVVRCALLPTYDEEIRWLADTITHLVDTGTPPGDIAVLCRGSREFPDIHAALVERDIPVEVVGLSGLLHLPEVADLVAICEVLQDPTANAALVRLLIGPRWRIGPRDLALLGRRARALVRFDQVDAEDDPDHRLSEAVAGVDPAEVVSLADALDTFLVDSRGITGPSATAPAAARSTDPAEPDDPAGARPQQHDDLAFSPQARVRFARLAAEIRELRRSLADPLMDVLHRILAVTGLEVELSASPRALAARRRETLSAFLDVAASFSGLDNDPSLGAFLGFLRTAAEYDKGLDNTLPGGEDTVKVLTAHKSKGLEWDIVAVPGLVARSFPSEKSRSLWTKNASVLPHSLRGDAETLPDVTEWSSKGLKGFLGQMREHQRIEELRLGYVAFTRPRRLLLGSGHWWGPSQSTHRGPSGFLDALRRHCEAGFGEVEAWADPPGQNETNPALAKTTHHQWPLPLDPEAAIRRRHAADRVMARLHAEPGPPPIDPAAADRAVVDGAAAELPQPNRQTHPEGDSPDPDPGMLLPDEARLVASWDRDLEALTTELRQARSTVRDVSLPMTLSASQLLRLAADPEGLAKDLARPMPREPQPAARRGTRFHAWVESLFAPRPLIEPDELPGIEDTDIHDEQDLETLKEAFLRSPYIDRTPYQVEAPFQMTLAGRVVRGRIDAVYRDQNGGYEVVDWKTHRTQTADPLQLSVYRLAWAEQMGVPVERVRAAFFYVRSGEVIRPTDLLDRPHLEQILAG